MKKILLLLSLFIFIISCSKQTPTLNFVESKFIPNTDTVLVVQPENYKNDKAYPLVILLHGWSGNYNQWNSMVNLQEYANAYNFIIACPDGFYDSWYINNPLKPQIQFEDFFWKDFIPYLKNNYSIDTSNIFISGLSMGGHGAITLFLKNPKFFKSAGSTSGILDLLFYPDRWSIKDGIGSIKDYPETWKNNSALYLLDSLKHRDKKMFIDCGTSDFAYEPNLNFIKRCYELKIPVEFRSLSGTHNHSHWKKMIPHHLEFFYNQIKINKGENSK